MYTVYNFISSYRNNKHHIEAYLRGDNVENFREVRIMGMSVIGFLIVMAIFLGLWFWAIYATIMFWNAIPVWARVVSVLFLVLGVPIVSLMVIYASKSTILFNHSAKPASAPFAWKHGYNW